MEMLISERSEYSHVSLVGRLDAIAVEQIEEEFSQKTLERGLPTVVDMSGVTFMSSLGIGFLLASTKRLKKANCKLILQKPEGLVESVLRTSKMDKVMPIVYTLEEGLKLLGIEVKDVPAAEPSAQSGAGRAESEGAPTASFPTLKLSIKNDSAELQDLYAKVQEFLDSHSTPYRSGYTVNLALEELVVNVLRYAYMDFDEHMIDISLSIVDPLILLTIEDDGRPFDPREGGLQPVEDAEDADDVEVGGLGLFLVLDMVDAMTYKRVNDRNRTEVRIKFHEVMEEVDANTEN